MIFSPNKDWVQLCTPNIEQSMTLSDIPWKSTQFCHPWPDFQKSTSPINEFYGFAKPCSRAVVLDQAGPCLESEWGAEGGYKARWIKMANYHCSISWAMSNVPNVQLSPPMHNVLFVQYVLPTEQAEEYLNIYVLIYHSTYICPIFFLKEHRKNSLKIIIFPWESVLRL